MVGGGRFLDVNAPYRPWGTGCSSVSSAGTVDAPRSFHPTTTTTTITITHRDRDTNCKIGLTYTDRKFSSPLSIRSTTSISTLSPPTQQAAEEEPDWVTATDTEPVEGIRSVWIILDRSPDLRHTKMVVQQRGQSGRSDVAEVQGTRFQILC